MISMMNNNFKLERKSDLNEISLFQMESPAEQETVVSGDMLDENRIHSSNGGVSGGDGFDGTVGVSSELVKEGLEYKVETRVLDNLQSSSGNDVVHVEPEKTGFEKVRVSSEVGSRGVDRKMESRVFFEEMDREESRVADSREMDMKKESRVSTEFGSTEMESRVPTMFGSTEMESRVSETKAEGIGRNQSSFIGESDLGRLRTKTEERAEISSGETRGDVEMMDKPTVLDSSPAYSLVAEGNSDRVSEAFWSEAEKTLSFGFGPGDMVWGKVKSHPWWPGQIFNEAFASSSVRRTKQEGHVLVAFFGDSSYGWFDPEELIPFDPHYAEKSRQTNSRIFMRAVEEAVDESRRRAALSLICYCRNPFNFRLTNVQGYFAVDVVDYEPGGIYSIKQIKNARYNFEPSEALSYVQKLAMNPRGNDQTGINSIKNVAMFLALRRATFEEFDETYAQAFGAQPTRPSRDSMAVLDQLGKVPSRAPLSGPMVFAEALGDMKSSSKPSKVKDQSKKDKYVLKKRDKPNRAGDYIFQKRTSTVSMKPQNLLEQEGIQTISRGVAALASQESGQESETMGGKFVVAKSSMDDAQINVKRVDLAAASSVGLLMTIPVAYSSVSASQRHTEDWNTPLDEDMNVLHEMNGRVAPIADVGTTSTSLYDSVVLERSEAARTVDSFDQKVQQENKAVDLHLESATSSNTSEGLEQCRQPLKDRSGPDEVWGFGDRVLGTNFDGVVKKGKVLKQPKNSSSDKTGIVEKKNKKKRKLGSEAFEDHPHKLPRSLKDGESVGMSAGKSTGISLAQRKNDGASLSSDSVLSSPRVDLANIKVELPQLVDDLLALALDPFHGVEGNSAAIVRHTILQFRSLVYQMSVVPVSTSEAETSELCENRSPALAAPAKMPLGKKPMDLSPTLRKPMARPDDLTKAGRKRSLSDRQEEKAAKRVKKLDELKSLTTGKMAGSQKVQELKQGERKEASVTEQKKPTKVDPVKKPEPLARAAAPAMLSLKFPPRTTLPSVPELKARFARFGPLDHSGFRVFWKSLTCRVVFKHKSHALAAYNYAIRNNLFGQVKVNYQVRDAAVPAAEATESSKRQVDDASDEVPLFRPGLIQQRSQQHPAVQLKSCLKKPSGEETGTTVDGVAKDSPRVRFKLGKEESDSRREEMMFSRNNNNYKNKNGSNAGGGGSSLSPSLTMDVNSKNFRKVIPQTQPLPSLSHNNQSSSSSSFDANESRRIGHFSKSSTYLHQQYHHHWPNQVQVEEQKNSNNTHNSTNTNKIDISSQMLSLMVRCNDIVMDITSSLGYLPYHSL